jgi:antitoxin ParD1/3/4
MPTMNVSLSQELAAFVEEEVASGEYGTASEVVRDGLRQLRRERAVRNEKATVLKREVRLGLKEARAGKFSRKTVADITKSVLARAGKRA